MKPKKKAQELFDKINIHIPINASFKDSAEEAIEKMTIDHLATKRISFILIDEIVSEHLFDGSNSYVEKRVDYWNEVKQELEKI